MLIVSSHFAHYFNPAQCDTACATATGGGFLSPHTLPNYNSAQCHATCATAASGDFMFSDSSI